MFYRSIALAALLLVMGPLLASADPPADAPKADLWWSVRLDDLDVEGKTLAQAVAMITEKQRMNFTCDWLSLMHAGVDREAKLHGRLINVRVDEAIQYLYTEAGGLDHVGYEGGVKNMKILGSDPKKPPLQTQFYNVKKLLASISLNSPPHGITAEPNLADADQIERVIMMSIDPDSWQEQGGSIGQFTVLGNVLAITQTPQNLKHIDQLLHDWEAARAK